MKMLPSNVMLSVLIIFLLPISSFLTPISSHSKDFYPLKSSRISIQETNFTLSVCKSGFLLFQLTDKNHFTKNFNLKIQKNICHTYQILSPPDGTIIHKNSTLINKFQNFIASHIFITSDSANTIWSVYTDKGPLDIDNAMKSDLGSRKKDHMIDKNKPESLVDAIIGNEILLGSLLVIAMLAVLLVAFYGKLPKDTLKNNGESTKVLNIH